MHLSDSCNLRSIDMKLDRLEILILIACVILGLQIHGC